MTGFEISFPSSRSVVTLNLKSPVCTTVLLIIKGRIVGFIPFSRVLALLEIIENKKDKGKCKLKLIISIIIDKFHITKDMLLTRQVYKNNNKQVSNLWYFLLS